MGGIILLCSVVVSYALITTIYRLFLSPIRHFPGPLLAALTFWYEGYYDVIKDGRYTWKIKELHEEYGPVVRINPCELHVIDPEFYHVLYTGAARRTDKWFWSARLFGTSDAIVGTVDHQLHHSRKNALVSYFSKTSVSRLEPLIQAKVELLRERLTEFCGRRQAVNLSDAFSAFSGDVIGSYVFGIDYGLLESPKFAPDWRNAMTELSRATHLMKQFGWAYPLVKRLADGLLGATLAKLYKPLGYMIDIQRSTEQAIVQARQRSTMKSDEKNFETEQILIPLIESLFRSTTHQLPPAELTTARLADEGLTLLGAGSVTTAQTLTTALYFILASAPIQSRLRAELAELYAVNPKPKWSRLSQLTYLTAVLHEALRLSYGVASRLPRIAPDDELILPDGRAIPKGTPISMTQMFIHDDPSLFHNPLSFDPERWLSSSDGSNVAQSNARKYFVPFSRGTRSCLGTNLAWAELYICVAGLFRPEACGGVRMELFDTSDAEVRVKHDYFNPAPAKGSKGVLVMIE